MLRNKPTFIISIQRKDVFHMLCIEPFQNR